MVIYVKLNEWKCDWKIIVKLSTLYRNDECWTQDYATCMIKQDKPKDVWKGWKKIEIIPEELQQCLHEPNYLPHSINTKIVCQNRIQKSRKRSNCDQQNNIGSIDADITVNYGVQPLPGRSITAYHKPCNLVNDGPYVAELWLPYFLPASSQ